MTVSRLRRLPKAFQSGVTFAVATAGCVGALIILPLSTAWAQSFTAQNVLSTANIYGAGRTGPASIPDPGGASGTAPGYGGGTAAPAFALSTGSGRILTFSSVTGTTTYDYANGTSYQTADGGGNGGDNTVVSAYQGISGIAFTTGHSELLGVFVSGPPAGYADGSSGSDAATLSYSSSDESNASYSPVLNQIFFIGDGLTGNGSGATQTFFVPDTATTLVLGFADGPNFQGPPGYYNDNDGTLTTSFSISSTSAPEPGSLGLLMSVGAISIPWMLRRRRKS